jgi:hypothetical protein
MRSRTSPVSLKAHSVKDLLARAVPALTHITQQAARQNFWDHWLTVHLPVELRRRISGVTERNGTLVIFAENAAWSARLRYAVLELEPDMRTANPGLDRIQVRVLPRS